MSEPAPSADVAEAAPSPAEGLEKPSAPVDPVETAPAEALSAPSGPSAAAQAPKTASSRSAALAALSSADAFLSHLHRASQARAGADVVLLFLTYAFRLSGTALESLGRSVLRRTARELIDLATKLPPSTTLVLDSATAPPAAALALQLAGRFKAAVAMLGEWRMMGRLWGLLGLYFSLKKLVLQSLGQTRAQESSKEKSAAAPSDSEARFDTLLAYAQVFALISYQSAENVAFLSSKKILGYSPATQAKLARWSVRSWALYIGMELGRLLVERSRKNRDATARSDAAWRETWYNSFTRNLAWAPITVHWSIDNGPLSDMMVAALAYYPASGYMKDLWKSTA